MRYLRLLPLLVMAFAAPAAADDHRVDMNLGALFASGSYLLGGRFAVGVPLALGATERDGHATKPWSGLFDVAIESGIGDNGYEKRETYSAGIRYTLPQSTPHHKIHVQGLAVLADRVKGADDDGGPVVVGIGWEFVPEPGNGSSHGLGLGAQLDAVLGDETQVRFTIGLVFRVKKNH